MNIIALVTIAVLALTGLWQPPFGPAKQAVAEAATRDTGTIQSARATTARALPVQTSSEPFAVSPDASVIAIDRASGTVLQASNERRRRPLASITKLMTALVVLDTLQARDIVTIPKLPDYDIEAETIGLQPGERYSVADLLAASLVPSANDAADALAIISAGSIATFTERMNAKLADWNIADAHFSNPSGLTDDNNFVTATSLAQIARLALERPEIVGLAAQTNGQITSLGGRVTTYRTTNALLYDGDFYGIKTGFTGAAGQCFVGLTRIDGHEVITIVLGSDDRFGDTRHLRSWIERAWTWL